MPPDEQDGAYANDLYYYKWGKEQRKDQGIRNKALAWDRAQTYEIFSEPFGMEISPDRTPEIIKLVETACKDAHHAVSKAKKHFKRMKPYAKFKEPSLKAKGNSEESSTGGKDNSYPSGHAAKGWTYALVLSTVAPERTEQLVNCAREFAMLRVIMGRHWKSDIDAGQTLATAVFADIVASDAFQKQLLKAREEYQSLKR